MFAKLLKYEWRSNAATLWILSACALGVSVLGGVLINLGSIYGERMPLQAIVAIFGSFGMSLLALFGYVAAVWIILLVRFYKSRFTDEGYLTFTLPVNAHQVFLSSALNMLIWSVISMVVFGVCVVVLLLISQLWEPVSDLVNLLSQVLAEMEEILGIAPLYILNYLLNLISSIVLMLTCLTVGSVIAKKHKILAAFGVYYGISMIVSFVTGMGSVVVMSSPPSLGAEVTLDGMYDALAYFQMVVSLALTLGGYFISTYLMKRELNLQ